MKAACTVWSGGKFGDYFKGLPITIKHYLTRRTVLHLLCRRRSQQLLLLEAGIGRSSAEPHSEDPCIWLPTGGLPSVLADNDPSTAESAEETLVESQPEESPAISPPTQSILESDEAAEDSEVDAENETPTSMDGETLTRMDNDGVMLLGGGGTMGKSTCVTFAAYQSARWKCHRYEVDGSHSYGHYFYTSESAYHTIDGVDSYCIERATRS